MFFDPRLSRDGKISCATCHDPAKSFTDGKTLSEGAATGDRHTPAIWNVAHHRWLFWDGRADTLWGQVAGPLESPNEMDGDRVSIARLIVQDDSLREAYVQIFGKLPNISDASRFPQAARPLLQSPQDSQHRAWQAMREGGREDINRVLANIGKALAAYETRLISRDSPFDRFVVQLKRNEKLDAISASAQRGLKLFVGRADCRQCHLGPMFSDGEFHNIRVPPLGGGEPTDAGRFRGIDLLRASPFNAAGRFSDDRDARRRSDWRFSPNRRIHGAHLRHRVCEMSRARRRICIRGSSHRCATCSTTIRHLRAQWSWGTIPRQCSSRCFSTPRRLTI